jgi:hypothetical protein
MVAIGIHTAPVVPPGPRGERLLSHSLSGARFYYEVRRGDSSQSLGSRYGVDPEVLAQANGRGVRYRLRLGDALWIDKRHIVPATITDVILINVPQRMLFVLDGDRLISAYPWPSARRIGERLAGHSPSRSCAGTRSGESPLRSRRRWPPREGGSEPGCGPASTTRWANN